MANLLKLFLFDVVMSWSFIFSWIKFDNGDEFLWVNISYNRWLSPLSCLPSLVESRGVNMYVLASTKWLISLRFVSSKLLHLIPKCGFGLDMYTFFWTNLAASNPLFGPAMNKLKI